MANSKETSTLLNFLESIPSVKNVRVYSREEQESLNIKEESPAVRRSIIRSQNQSAKKS